MKDSVARWMVVTAGLAVLIVVLMALIIYAVRESYGSKLTASLLALGVGLAGCFVAPWPWRKRC